jgi:hemolysin D
MQNLVFPVTLSLEKTAISADGEDVALSNGMAVTVEIKTGSRRLIDYVLSPLAEVASASMKER